jgi:hypothetical protein
MITLNAACIACVICLHVGALLGIVWGCLAVSSRETREEETPRLSANDRIWLEGQ